MESKGSSNGGKVKVKLKTESSWNPGGVIRGATSGRDGPPHYPPHGHPPPGGQQGNQMDVGVLQTTGEGMKIP